MEEMNDYRGEFRPDQKMEAFSKEALIEFCHAAANMYTSQAQCWHDVIEEQYGTQVMEESETLFLRRRSRGPAGNGRFGYRF